jgi:hypothetical protein
MEKTNNPPMRSNEDRIMFQNQSHLVQKYFADCGICPSMWDLARMTDVMVMYVKHGRCEVTETAFKRADEHIKATYNPIAVQLQNKRDNQ